jgi:hypothetical protein
MEGNISGTGRMGNSKEMAHFSLKLANREGESGRTENGSGGLTINPQRYPDPLALPIYCTFKLLYDL